MLALGTMAERAVRSSVEALVRRDLAAGPRIMEDDHLINERRFDLENEILTIIATQQPLAGDLRKLASCWNSWASSSGSPTTPRASRTSR